MGKTLSQGQAEKFLDEVDKYMIQVTKDPNGTFTTQPTKFQKEKAIERIKSEVEISLGHKEKGSAPWKPVAPKDTSEEDQYNRELLEGWKATHAAFKGDFTGMNKADYDYEFYSEGDKYKGVPVLKKFVLVRSGKTGDRIAIVDNPKALAEFTYEGSTAAGSQEMWNQAELIMNPQGGDETKAPAGGQAR
jgi:hypothetical protein